MYFIAPFLLIQTALCDCYWNDKTSYEYFSGITPYDDVRGDIRDVQPLKGCEPINLWFMVRHGTRHPGHDDMETMKNAMSIKQDILRSHAAGGGHLCAQDITNLMKWNWNESMDSTTWMLTDEGYQELLEFGERFHKKFYSLLEALQSYNFRPSAEQRTITSAKAFVKGLGRNRWSFKVSDAVENDDVVRPYRHCDRRIEQLTNRSHHIHNAIRKYHETEEFKEMLINMRKRIAIDHELTPHNVTGLYDLCRFYRAYSETKRNPWCALFNNKELEIMEYIEDIRHYFRNGYGSGSVNVKLGEVALKDMFEKFQSGNDTKSITGYFTHDTMIEMVYSALGLYKDYPAISGLERLKKRLWRSSLFAPFAANFVAIMNRCNSTEGESLKVQFFINEIELHICEDRACSWEDFIEKFSLFSDSNLEFCQTKKL